MMKKLLVIIVNIAISTSLMGQSYSSRSETASIGKEQVVAQMNYCINSITNIVHYKSMPLLEHEIDQLLNNLTMEQVVGLYDVQSFRSEMLEKISALQITEEEKELIKRVQELQRENMLYQSISSSLNPTMLLTGGGNSGKQLAFMAIITIARTAVEYKSASNDADIEELQAMWQYRKADLQNFADLRKDALELVYSLFQKYHLNESDRLTEATSTLFSQIISEADPQTRVRKLIDNKATFSGIAEYYYYTGMAYVDAGDYNSGKDYLNTYLSMYHKAPIFRYDEKSGCVALTKLALEPGLSRAEINGLVDAAISNLPNNGPALIQCVLALNDAGEKEKAFNILRSGIDNHLISDKDALVMLATKLMPEIKKYPSSLSQICAAISNCNGLSVNAYLPYLLESDINRFWKELPQIVNINKDGLISINSNYVANINSLGLYAESHRKGHIAEDAFSLSYDNAISLKTINKKFKTIRAIPESVFIFFDPISGNETFKIKDDLDFQKVLDAEYPGLQQYYFPLKEREKIVSFCKKNIERTDTDIKIRADKETKGKRLNYRTAYCDYAYYPDPVVSLSIDDNNTDNPEAQQCQIESRRMDGIKIHPFKGQPKELTRLEFYGLDTLAICFNVKKGSQPYSVSNGKVIYYTEPLKTYNVYKLSGKAETEKDIKNESWLSRMWHGIFHKTVKTDERDEINKAEKENSAAVGKTESWFHHLWRKIIPEKSSDTNAVKNKPHKKGKAQNAIDETVSEPNSGDIPQKTKDEPSWFGKLWDKIIFWK